MQIFEMKASPKKWGEGSWNPNFSDWNSIFFGGFLFGGFFFEAKKKTKKLQNATLQLCNFWTFLPFLIKKTIKKDYNMKKLQSCKVAFLQLFGFFWVPKKIQRKNVEEFLVPTFDFVCGHFSTVQKKSPEHASF